MRVFQKNTTAIEHIQVYGERNSGTTYLVKLLQDNMKTPDNLLGMLESETTPLGNKIFGYKHWFPVDEKLKDPRQSQTLFIVIYRNPYTWIKAMMTRPYALSGSLAGHPVRALPKIKLAGHINGRDTKNEFDPETGEQLTLFELRLKKIEYFEGLKRKVDNVVYINLEELLDDRSSVLDRLREGFGSVFTIQAKTDRAPYKQLLQEYQTPDEFTAKEVALLDKHIHWGAERFAGYQKGILSKSGPKPLPFVILHGGSSVGKSHLMQTVQDQSRNHTGIEMDDCKYWKEGQPEYSCETLASVVSGASPKERAAFGKLVEKRALKGNRCIQFLLENLSEILAPSQSPSQKPAMVISTCGALPNPTSPGTPSIYSFLEEHLPVSFHHLLVDIPAKVHDQRMQARGRSHLRDDILRDHAKKTAARDLYAGVVADNEDISDYIRKLTGLKSSKEVGDFSPRPPSVRIHKAGPRYIQIYGERNSGTKYLTQLISENALDPDVVLGSYASKKDPVNKAKMIGYKHYYPQAAKLAQHQSKTLFLVVYKNPYTWIRSMLSKPYHFKECLAGKTIEDLPSLELAGFDIHGREIPDVHPVTGKRITMFELRKYKILEWEKLSQTVDNVVFVNYEDLLLSATAMMQSITDEFAGLFHAGPVKNHIPDPKYVKKYVSPKPFTDRQMQVMNDNIDWSTEAIAGYEKDNLFIPD